MTLQSKPPNMTEEQFEAICKHCGVCCGSADGDPCIYLEEKENSKYFCRIYKERFGSRITIKGNSFRCIPIELAINYSNIKKVCAYTKVLNHKK